jgi:mRNA interferase RelE/StbE
MRLALTDRFKRAYRGLTAEEQALADKALRLLAENLRHPSLHVKKIKGTEGIWEARVSRSIRLTFEVHGDLLVLRTIGRHDETLGRP